MIFRSMLQEDSSPVIGIEDNMLGVRIPPSDPCDVTPDDQNFVNPGDGGLSVCSGISKLPRPLIPKRFRDIDPRYKNARGDEPLEIFRLGDREFAECRVSSDLHLKRDNTRHGTIEPCIAMSIDKFQSALEATHDEWIIVPDPDGS